jgi:hypothetical protein
MNQRSEQDGIISPTGKILGVSNFKNLLLRASLYDIEKSAFKVCTW